MDMQALLDTVYAGNTLRQYGISLAIVIIGILVVTIVGRVVLGRVKALAERTRTSFDDFVVQMVEAIGLPLGYFISVYLSVKMLVFEAGIEKLIAFIAIAVATFCVTRFITRLNRYVFSVYWRKRGKDLQAEHSLQGILRVINILIWAIAVAFYLDNLGVKITAVVAGLGIGGVAVALAAQAVLGDLFSYLAILFDRPFELGDFIIVGDCLGTVERIGIKTTRITSLSGEQLVFSNSDLTNSRVRNYKKMAKRRVVFSLGVVYQTELKKLQEIPDMIKDIIAEIEHTTFDRAHFFKYGDFSLVFEVVYYVTGSDYNTYMDIQQEINFKIYDAFEKKGIEFAYPTQKLYVTQES